MSPLNHRSPTTPGIRLSALVLLSVLSACPARDEHAGHEHEGPAKAQAHVEPAKAREAHGHDDHDDHAAHDEGEAHADERDDHPDELRVDRVMLRDLRLSLAPAAARSAAETVTALGELRVNEDAYAEVGTPIAARVARIAAGPGDRVRAGQVLAELDSPDVGRARAAVATAEARVALSRQTAERRRQLAADQLVPARELQEAEAELTQAEVEVAAARQALVSLGAVRGSGATLELVSPLSGTVIDRNAIRGRMVEASAPLFVVGDLSRLWLIAHVFERDALRLRLATQARVSFPALPGQTFTGTVTQLGSRVDPASRTIDVRVVVDNTRGQLRPGMSASASLAVGDANETVVVVPVVALQKVATGWCVFVPRDEEGAFEIRRVARGRDLGGEVEVLSGLRAGERVVTDGAFLLKAEADKARGSVDEHHH
jgi:cobalt-zinc-cadmium efflux system membrane fusion protein